MIHKHSFIFSVLVRISSKYFHLPFPIAEIPIYENQSYHHTLSINLDGGNFFTQIDRFCIQNQCTVEAHQSIVQYFKRKLRMYWFPAAHFVLDTINEDHTIYPVRDDDTLVSQYEWLPLISYWKSYVTASFKSCPSKEHRTFYTIFAGRQVFMDTHFRYTDLLLKLNLVTEVHIWDFVDNSSSSDSHYIADYIRDSNLSGYQLFRRPIRDQSATANLEEGYLFQSYYYHYSTNRRYHSNDIIIKADDDILFIDLASFQLFIQNISHDSFHFPNILNNDATFPIHARRNVHPRIVKFHESYDHTGIDLYDRMTSYMDPTRNITAIAAMKPCPITAVYCSHEGDGFAVWHGSLIYNGLFARRMHKIFFENPLQFIDKSAQKNEQPRFEYAGQRIPLNMFAVRASLFRKAFSQYLTPENCCSDEDYVGKWPSISGHKHVIDTHFTVVHFAYAQQRVLYDGDLTYDASIYSYLSRIMQHELEPLLNNIEPFSCGAPQ